MSDNETDDTTTTQLPDAVDDHGRACTVRRVVTGQRASIVVECEGLCVEQPDHDGQGLTRALHSLSGMGPPPPPPKPGAAPEAAPEATPDPAT